MHVPRVVEPDIAAVHAQIEHVIQIFPAGDPRVERHATKCLTMKRQTTTAHMVRARQARALHGFGNPLVECGGLVPIAVVPFRGSAREIFAFFVQIKARLRKNRHAASRKLAQAIHRLFQKRGIVNHHIIVDEYHRIEIECARKKKPQVAHCAIACKTHFVAQSNVELLHALAHKCHLGSAHHGDIQIGKLLGNGANFARGLILDSGFGNHEHNDMPKPAHAPKRFEAAGQLARGRHRCCMVVCRGNRTRFNAPTRGHERGNNHNWVHGHSFPSLEARCVSSLRRSRISVTVILPLCSAPPQRNV